MKEAEEAYSLAQKARDEREKKRIAKKKISKGIGILMKRTIFLD